MLLLLLLVVAPIHGMLLLLVNVVAVERMSDGEHPRTIDAAGAIVAPDLSVESEEEVAVAAVKAVEVAVVDDTAGVPAVVVIAIVVLIVAGDRIPPPAVMTHIARVVIPDPPKVTLFEEVVLTAPVAVRLQSAREEIVTTVTRELKAIVRTRNPMTRSIPIPTPIPSTRKNHHKLIHFSLPIISIAKLSEVN